MIQIDQIQRGAAKYIEDEMISRLTGWQKWVIGSAAALALSRTGEIFNTLSANEAVKLLGVIGEDNAIDIDKLYAVFKEQAKKSPVTFDVPLIGAVTLTEADVDKLYNYIMKG